MSYDAVLFDWDGTLWDSVHTVFSIYKDMFSEFGLPPLEEKDFKNRFTSNYHKYYRLMGYKGSLEEADSKWIKMYEEREHLIKPVKGALDVVKLVKEKGLKTGIVSDGSDERIRAEVKEHGFGPFIDVIVTDKDVPEFKPDPKCVAFGVKKLGVEPGNALYVGDMDSDIAAGKGAGLKVAGVLTGFHSRERLFISSPDYVLESVLGVREII